MAEQRGRSSSRSNHSVSLYFFLVSQFKENVNLFIRRILSHDIDANNWG